MRRLLCVLAVLLAGTAAAADLRAVDGDTLKDAQGYIRLLGFDAPELHRPQCPVERYWAARAQERLQQLAEAGLTLTPGRRRLDKYGRRLMLATTADGQPVAALMIREHLARPYDGGKRDGWCTPGLLPLPGAP